MAKLYLGTREVTPAITVSEPITDISKANYIVKTDGVVELLERTDDYVLPLFEETVSGEGVWDYDYQGNQNIKALNCSCLKVIEPSLKPSDKHINFSGCSNLTRIDFSSVESCGGRTFYTGNGSKPAFKNCTSLLSIDFSSLKTAGEQCFYMSFQNTAITQAYFPELETANDTCFSECFINCSNLIEVDFPKLKEIYSECMTTSFKNCTSLKKVYFTALDTLVGYSHFLDAFDSCTSIEDIYFNSLKENSFEDDMSFEMMMYNTGSNVVHTIHFPSNMESTIENMLGYPNFDGESGYVVLAFDLPATS